MNSSVTIMNFVFLYRKHRFLKEVISFLELVLVVEIGFYKGYTVNSDSEIAKIAGGSTSIPRWPMVFMLQHW